MAMGLSFFLWAMVSFDGQRFGICGKTIESLRRNVLSEILPKLEEPPALPQAVLALLISIENFQERGLRDLMRIASDGKVSDDEILPYGQALSELNEMVRAAYAVGYAKE